MIESFGLSEKISEAESKCLSCGAPLPESRAEQRRFTGGQSSILILGTEEGDIEEKTLKLMEEVKRAVNMSGRQITVEVLLDNESVASYCVSKLPALVINGSIVSQGIISDADEILSEIEFLL